MTKKLQSMVNSWLWKFITPLLVAGISGLFLFIAQQGVARIDANAQEIKDCAAETRVDLKTKVDDDTFQMLLRQMTINHNDNQEAHKVLNQKIETMIVTQERKAEDQQKRTGALMHTLHKIELHLERVDAQMGD